MLRFLAGYAGVFLAAVGLAALLVQFAGATLGTGTLQVVGGVALAAFGLQVLGRLRLPGGGPCRGPVGFFLGRAYGKTPGPGKLGASFALYCAGCCGPAAIGSALLLAGGPSAWRAGLLLLGYGLGMAIPFIFLAAGLAFAFRRLKQMLRYAPIFSAVGGGLAVIMGLLLVFRPVTLFLLSG